MPGRRSTAAPGPAIQKATESRREDKTPVTRVQFRGKLWKLINERGEI